MADTLRQQVVVGEGGRIVIDVPQLAPGTRAEVTVTEAPEETLPTLVSLIGSCSGMLSSDEEADASR